MEVGLQESFKMKLQRSRLKLAGHVERMGDGKLAMKADAYKVERKGSEDDRNWDGRTALRKTRKEREKIGDQEIRLCRGYGFVSLWHLL